MPRRGDLFAGILPFFPTAEERSFRRAAHRLGISSAAVSKAVLKLEDELGLKLLARTSRSVALTPEGALFLERCREAIGSVQAGRELLSASGRQPRGDVRISMPFILGRVVVPEFPRLSSRYPNLALRVSMTDRFVRLVDEEVDVAVRIGELRDSSLVARSLATTRWVSVASPTYVARAGTPAHPGDLARFNCLRFLAPDGRPRDWTFRDPRSAHVFTQHVHGNFLIDQGEHLLAAARAGLGICQALDFMVESQLSAGALVEVLAAWAPPGPPIHALSVRERSRSANVRALVAFLVDVFRRARAE